ncbi:alpha/beta-hydrolase [Ascobolus immersus RN42]|uniref:Carboxylic ester hydrolase n=1 Tax=Ascobolus immersus RN42 TaxID=1160509 RepID=A0A3N4HE34_ASCIM|nr:alpha/beta-hydrolase [Ascobolus immersus RN42]
MKCTFQTLLFLSATSPAFSTIPTVHTPSGLIHGTPLSPTVDGFLGIPYALHPIGSLRFKPPQPIPKPRHNKPINATSFGPACYQFLYYEFQFPPLQPTQPQSEDCLTLNVWRPSNAAGATRKGLPVMVWIHGGGFTAGSSDTPVYDAQRLVKNTGNVIIVSMNYRLGLFGFPLTPAIPLTKTNPGLLDQRLALEWVRTNIRSFGGDPFRITLFGQSAGSSSVDYMSFAYPKDPIASAMIMQSGQVNLFPGDNVDADGASWKTITDGVGCTSDDRAKELACMRGIEAARLQEEAYKLKGGWTTAPHVDGVLVLGRKEYGRRLNAGKFARIPTLISNTDNEGDILIMAIDPGNLALSDALTKTSYTCPAAQAALARSKVNHLPVWRYRWMGAFPSVRILPWLRAYHSIDTFWVFGGFTKFAELGMPAATERELRAEKWIQGLFTGFAGDPRGTMRKLGWKEFEAEKKTLAELFPDDETEVRFVRGGKYDEGCVDDLV